MDQSGLTETEMLSRSLTNGEREIISFLDLQKSGTAYRSPPQLKIAADA